MHQRSLFAGKREAAEVPAKRGPGRPPKVRKREEEEDQQPDPLLEALLLSMPGETEAYDERLRVSRHKRKAEEAPGSCSRALLEVSGNAWADLRMPGSIERSCKQEGPQVSLRLCKWFEEKLEELSGSGEMHELLLGAVAEKWQAARFQIVGILRDQAKWQAQCLARGVSVEGLMRDEAQMPQYLVEIEEPPPLPPPLEAAPSQEWTLRPTERSRRSLSPCPSPTTRKMRVRSGMRTLQR